jgi:excisionase family DNA binding protein
MSGESYYLKAGQVAERLNIHRSHVYRLLEKGELPSVRIGRGTVRVPEAALDAYIETRMQGAPPEPRRADLTPLPGDLYELVEEAKAFEERTGHDPFQFVELWRRGKIPDNAENADLAISAIALRAAMIEAGAIPLKAG